MDPFIITEVGWLQEANMIYGGGPGYCAIKRTLVAAHRSVLYSVLVRILPWHMSLVHLDE